MLPSRQGALVPQRRASGVTDDDPGVGHSPPSCACPKPMPVGTAAMSPALAPSVLLRRAPEARLHHPRCIACISRVVLGWLTRVPGRNTRPDQVAVMRVSPRHALGPSASQALPPPRSSGRRLCSAVLPITGTVPCALRAPVCHVRCRFTSPVSWLLVLLGCEKLS